MKNLSDDSPLIDNSAKQQPSVEDQVIPSVEASYLFVLPESMAQTVLRALDELPGKIGRPVFQVLMGQSPREKQRELMGQIAQHFETLTQQEATAGTLPQ